jgi:PAS domain S-box-containing protein
MIRPSEHAASSPEPGPTSERHIVVGRLPAQVAALLASREDGAQLWTVWGFDSYFRAANQRLLRLLGWTEAELSSASYWDFVHPDDQHPLVEALDRMMATADWLAGYEIRVLGRDGGWRRMQWDIIADRGTELMFGVGAEIFVGESADGLARAPVGTWVRQGRAGTFTWSDELYAMFGIPVGTPLTDGLIRSRIHPQDYQLVEQVWRARLADSEAHGVHFRTILPDGTTRHLECTGRVMARSDGRATTVRGITIDVTTGPAADPAPEGAD